MLILLLQYTKQIHSFKE